MGPRTVLVADSSEDFCSELYSILRWECRVETCSRGSRALKRIRELRPDVLVLDLMLPEMDGISLLKALDLSDCSPAILATTSLISPYIVDQAQQMKVDYLICKPCDIHATAARIQEQLHRLDSSGPEDLPCRITELLLMLGFSAKLNGFKYLREAISEIAHDPDQSITKELYPSVAQVCGSAPSHVERSIRGANQDAWDHRDPKIWQLYFQPCGNSRESRPTNAVFISRIADGLRSLQSREPELPELVPSAQSALSE